jgi:hypothetical protein
MFRDIRKHSQQSAHANGVMIRHGQMVFSPFFRRKSQVATGLPRDFVAKLPKGLA